MSKFVKFKKRDFMDKANFLKKVVISFEGEDNIKNFKEDVVDEMKKKEFRIFDKITLFGKEGEAFITKPKKDKFKDFKSSLSEADVKKVDHIEIELLKNMAPELDLDDLEFVSKIIKRLCKKYNALVKYKTV